MIARYERSLLLKALTEKGTSLITYVAKLSTDPLLFKDIMKLDSIVHDVNSDEEVFYAVIADAGEKILTSRLSSLNTGQPQIAALVSAVPQEAEVQGSCRGNKKSRGDDRAVRSHYR